ncbi:beta-ketoacyl synthase N-terminal-like domain-containing protein [Streptomyces sp. NPDC020801]|uniref:beta-ketoacyl synthase N-terminal-like domain-containing protein n=1 Tax=unclassified Streptomyces TaxID=2593676 RepID=UPI00379C295D
MTTGISARFPGTVCKEHFWDHLLNRRESVAFLRKEETEVDHALVNPDRTATMMSFEHRIHRESGWDVLEDSVRRPERVLEADR